MPCYAFYAFDAAFRRLMPMRRFCCYAYGALILRYAMLIEAAMLMLSCRHVIIALRAARRYYAMPCRRAERC